MKKLFLAFVFAALSLGVFAQNGFTPVYVVADSSTKFNRVLEIGTPVYCVSLSTLYFTNVRIGKTNTYTVGWLLGSTSRYTRANTTTWNAFDMSFFVDTINDQNIYGSKAFYSPVDVKLGSSLNNVGVGGTTNLSNLTTGQYNVSLGPGALRYTTSGNNNIGIGSGALQMASAASGSTNVAIGTTTLGAITTGSSNVGVGYGTLTAETTGIYNVAIGPTALPINVGSRNIGIGNSTGFYNATGSNNVFIGDFAGKFETGSNKLVINNTNGGRDTALIYGDFNTKSLQVNDTLKTKRFVASETVTSSYTVLTATDTSVSAPVGAIIYRQADSTLWIKIKATGTKAARWNKVTVGK